MNLQRREEIRFYANGLESSDGLCAEECKEAILELLAHIDTLEQTAAERVIDSGRIEAAEALAERLGKTIECMDHGVRPSSTERCAARWATSSATDRGSFERGWEAREAEGIEVAIGASPTPDYTGDGSVGVPSVEAQAMVVPALTDEDLNRYSMDCDERDAVEFGYNLATSRIMPAGRVTIPPLTGGEIEARLLRLFPGISEDDPLREACFKDSRWAYNLAVSRARAIPADRVLGEGVVALRRFAERCAQRDHQPDEHIGCAKCVACEAEDALRANQGGGE